MKLRLLCGAAATALIFACAVTSCSDKGEAPREHDVAFDLLKSQVAYTLDGSASAFASDSDLSFGSEINMLLPVKAYGNDVAALRDSILKLAFDTVGSDYSALMAAYENAAVSQVGFPYTAIENENDPAAAFLSTLDGYTCVQGNVANMTPEIMSYQLILSEYPMRAAHGDYTIRYINYDMNAGKVFSLSDIITPEGLEALPKILKERARTVISVIGPTTLVELPSANNFFINNKGDIVFAYQPYEIASYAQGAVQVKVAPYVISQYLTSYGKDLLLY